MATDWEKVFGGNSGVWPRNVWGAIYFLPNGFGVAADRDVASGFNLIYAASKCAIGKYVCLGNFPIDNPNEIAELFERIDDTIDLDEPTLLDLEARYINHQLKGR